MAEENTSNGKDERADRLKARIALAVQERISPGKCPSAQELAAFTDGMLDEKERDKILTHLDTCPNCREDWLGVTSVLELDPKEGGTINSGEAAAREKDKKPGRTGYSRIGQIKEKVFFQIPRPVSAGIGLAMAASIIVVVSLALRPPQMSTLIAKSYGDMKAKQGHVDIQALHNSLRLPWEKAGSGFGFSGSSHPSEASTAFAAGLWTGREQLAGERQSVTLPEYLRPASQKQSASPDLWNDSKYSSYYWTGEWVILLKAACTSDKEIDAAFWNKQKKTLERGESLFSNDKTKEAKMLTEILKGSGALIVELEKSPSNQRACSNLRSELDSLAQRLAPE